MIETTQHTHNVSTPNDSLNGGSEAGRSTKSVGKRFIGALSELESGRDIEQIVALFTDDCEVSQVPASKYFYGVDGVRLFWTQYRDAFIEVHSILETESYSDNAAVLEWTTEGDIKSGGKIKYDALSILETQGEKITRFYAYFDPGRFGWRVTEAKNFYDSSPT